MQQCVDCLVHDEGSCRVDDRMQYFQFLSRTAVGSAFMNGERALGESVYPTCGLRHRPTVNSSWALVFNPLDEVDNLDVALDDLDDIRLFVKDTDFTVY